MTNAIVIVAHPDDETIWMGGTILRYSSWDWTIYSLCRSEDKDRAPKFRKVCKNYGANGIISNLDDEKLEKIETEKIIHKIKENISNLKYDYVFTHGGNGEYGHIRHQEVHKAVKEMVEKNKLICNKLYFFSYQIKKESQNNQETTKVIPKDDNFKIKLKEDEFKKKIKIIKEDYGFTPNSFEVLSCSREETFSIN